MSCSKKHVSKNLDTLRLEVCQKCPGLFCVFHTLHYIDVFFRGFWKVFFYFDTLRCEVCQKWKMSKGSKNFFGLFQKNKKWQKLDFFIWHHNMQLCKKILKSEKKISHFTRLFGVFGFWTFIFFQKCPNLKITNFCFNNQLSS